MARGLADFSPEALRATRRLHRPHGGQAGMTAEELGRAVGASKAQILAYENGHRVPDPARIKDLAQALGVHPSRLMSLERSGTWGVADIRRACGLRAQDVVGMLSISPKSYRRFELEGIVPARRSRFLDDVANVFGIHHTSLERAITNIPAVQTRRQRTIAVIQAMAHQYVQRPGPWRGPDPDDTGLLELAALYGRPAQRIRRVLAFELGELRQKLVRAERERVVGEFDVDEARQQRALSAHNRWNELYLRDLKRVPQRLERFHRSAQPANTWVALVDLSNAEARGDGPWAVTSLLATSDTIEQLPPSLVEHHAFDDVRGCRLTSRGVAHVQNFRELYAALYPSARRPQRRGNSTGVRGTENIFVLPSRSERFVVPQPALDRARRNKDGPVVFRLSSRDDLRVGPNSWTWSVVQTSGGTLGTAD